MSFRRGVSLMEVLVSIGVVAVGLMGVATLIPLAFQQAEAGAQNERKSSLSQRAFREFQVQGMADSRRWVEASPLLFGDPIQPVGLHTITTAPIAAPVVARDSTGIPRTAVCIDPRWVANNTFEASSVNIKADISNHFTFPAMKTADFSANDVREYKGDAFYADVKAPAVMPRVSLTPAFGVGSIMSLAQADEVFSGQDDLTFELPDQADLPPVQTPLTGASGPTKRYAEGGFSWFATLVPEEGMSDLYKLSIAVTHQRNLAGQEIALPVISPDMRTFEPDVPGSGVSFGGGDIVVDTSVLGTTELPFSAGEYVMLSRHAAVQAGAFRQRFQWYRIVSIENLSEQGSALLTLNGADWDFKPVDVPVVEQTYLLYTPGVTSVYEKTIRLEKSSMWMQQ